MFLTVNFGVVLWMALEWVRVKEFALSPYHGN
jgi:hypothetical protein